MKYLYYFTQRFQRQNLKKTVPIYLISLIILFMFGVKGLMITFFFIMSFVSGWMTKAGIQAFKDYRLSLAMNRINFTAVEYQAMKRENSALLDALNQYRKNGTANGVRGGQSPRGPIGRGALFNEDQIEQLKMRMEMDAEREYTK